MEYSYSAPELVSSYSPFSSLTNYRPYKPDMRPCWHQLLIIGNGFDLECGLPSSFGHFFTERMQQFSRGKTNYRMTMWDVILTGRRGDSWCDIEGAVRDWVAPEDIRPLSPLTSFGKCLSVLDNHQGNKEPTVDADLPEKPAIEYLWNKYGNTVEVWSEDLLLSIVFRELHTLEEDFSTYLSEVVKTCSDYKDRVSRLMIEMIAYARPNTDDFDVEDSILSFNYTHSVNRFASEEHQVSYLNIHGQLGGEIVFGIDGTGMVSNKAILPLTKTYRLMSLDLPDRETLIHLPNQNNSLDYGTMAIKFYGHSLGEADYSYFQSIFDALHLYEGRTRLVFFFRAHPGFDANEAKEEMMGKAIRLLSAYGATLENKDHGKNLVHKLLIEGRLSVTELPNTVRVQ